MDYSTRFTLYELKLNPANPMQYEYDSQWRDITAQTVSVKSPRPTAACWTRSALSIALTTA